MRYHDIGQDAEKEISDGKWLSDLHINASQGLIKDTSPYVGGLLDTGLGVYNQFPIERGEFVQILHIDGNHWVTISTVGLSPGHVEVFDILYREISPNLREKVFKIMSTEDVRFSMPSIVQQENTSDCGVFAVAAAAEVFYSRRRFNFCTKKSRNHLLACLKKGKMSPFPKSSKVAMLPSV